MNIAQGGSGFPVLSPALYKYMCTGEYIDLPLEDINVPHSQARHRYKNVYLYNYAFVMSLISVPEHNNYSPLSCSF